MLYCLGNDDKNKTSSVYVQYRPTIVGLITWYTPAKSTDVKPASMEAWLYFALGVHLMSIAFPYFQNFHSSFLVYPQETIPKFSNYMKFPQFLFSLLFVYSSITVFISIDLVFHTLKNTHPHFSQFWQHSSHVQLIFRSPTVPSTVCSRRSININLIKQSNVV